MSKQLYADMTIEGAIGDDENNKRASIAIQRVVDGGGDSIIFIPIDNDGAQLAYMVPTECIKRLLEKPLTEDGDQNVL